MADLFADEHIPPFLQQSIGKLGHTVIPLRRYNEKPSGDGWEDSEVLRFASDRGWAVLTFNAKHYLALAKTCGWHRGIVLADPEKDKKAQARRIHQAIRAAGDLRGQVIDTRIAGAMPKNRPSRQKS